MALIQEAVARRDQTGRPVSAGLSARARRGLCRRAAGNAPRWTPHDDAITPSLAPASVRRSICSTTPASNEDIRSLRELLIYGLKGLAAYADHAYVLGYQDDEVLAFMQEALAATCDDTPDGQAT